MRKKYVAKLDGTEKLGRNMYNADGRILLNAGVVLSKSYIDRLNNMGIPAVYVQDKVSEGILAEDYLSDKVRQGCKKLIRESIARYLKNGKESFEDIIDASHKIIDDVASSKGIVINITDIKTAEDYFISHAINVCALSIVLALKMGYNMLKIKDIASGAILHDIGKICILKEKNLPLKKIHELEKENLTEHPRQGYDIMSKLWAFSSISKVMILMHHENIDGSGFPMKMKGNDIHEAAKIIRVCDTFDNMISGNSNPKKMLSESTAINYLKEKKDYFDSNVCDSLAQIVASYPAGIIIELSNGRKGIVIKQNDKDLTRPIVKLLKKANGVFVQDTAELNLVSDSGINIVGVCEDF
jgi:HD-GYP domain-containing protein (c-di-GMP phosphodiesterase class II)